MAKYNIVPALLCSCISQVHMTSVDYHVVACSTPFQPVHSVDQGLDPIQSSLVGSMKQGGTIVILCIMHSCSTCKCRVLWITHVKTIVSVDCLPGSQLNRAQRFGLCHHDHLCPLLHFVVKLPVLQLSSHWLPLLAQYDFQYLASCVCMLIWGEPYVCVCAASGCNQRLLENA